VNSQIDPLADHPVDRVIPLIRLSGFLMLTAGMFIAIGYWDILDPEIGLVIAVFGLIELLFVPIILEKVATKKRDDFLAGKSTDGHDRP